MDNQPSGRFALFLRFFPVLPLPQQLTEEGQVDFSKGNEILPGDLIEAFILPAEEENPDDLTEFVPCFQIGETKDFHAVIYWKAELMSYQYRLVTYDHQGKIITSRVIAGTYSDGETLIQSMAIIEPDWEIIVVSGAKTKADPAFDASTSTTYSLELLPDGKIINQIFE